MDFGSFTFQAPKEWKKLKLNTYDSNAGIIVTPNNDSIHYDYGPYSNSLEEEPVIISKKFLKEILRQHPKIDTTEFIIINDNATINKENFIKSKITYKNINGYHVKILEPKHIGKGITGIYIDSINNGSLEKIKFNLYGKNLAKENQIELLKVIHTLQFIKH